uniref:Serpentine receptor class gamma n=1 Tax=Parastrongyloides trichosuri TaxID=131310 RepID=A0A0N4ZAN5_PARTI
MIPIPDAIFLVVQCFGYILYIMMSICFLYKLITGNKHDSDTNTFLIHFIANCVIDITQVCTVIFFQKFLHWMFLFEFLTKTESLRYIYAPLIYMAMLASVLGCTFTVINRYCALCYAVDFREKWTNNVSFCLIAFQIIFPIAAFSFNFFNRSTIIYVETFNFYLFTIPSYTVSMVNNIIFATLIFLCTLTTILMNIIIFKKFSKIMENVSEKEKHKKHLMMIYMIITTICMITLFVEQFARFLFIQLKMYDAVYFTAFPLFWILPILTLAQPVTTLIMSKYMRQYFILFYFHNIIPKRVLPDEKEMNNTKSISDKKSKKPVSALVL